MEVGKNIKILVELFKQIKKNDKESKYNLNSCMYD